MKKFITRDVMIISFYVNIGKAKGKVQLLVEPSVAEKDSNTFIDEIIGGIRGAGCLK